MSTNNISHAEQTLAQRVLRWIRGVMMRRMPLMITCREFEDFLIDYLDGTLSSKQRLVFEFHLKLCREYRDYLAAYQRAIEFTQHVFRDPEAALPKEVPEDLVRAVLAAKSATRMDNGRG